MELPLSLRPLLPLLLSLLLPLPPPTRTPDTRMELPDSLTELPPLDSPMEPPPLDSRMEPLLRSLATRMVRMLLLPLPSLLLLELP